MRRWLCILIAFGAVAHVNAQADLSETYIQPDEFGVDYPSGGQVEVDPETGLVQLVIDEARLTLYSPAVLQEAGFENYNPATLLRLLVALNDVIAGEVDLIEPDGALLTYERGNDAGILVAQTFVNGTVGVIDAYGPEETIHDLEGLVLAIAVTFDVPPVAAPDALVNFAGYWSDAIGELEDSGLIPAGGEIVFAEGYTFASGSNRIQPLAQSVSVRDVVMVGNLTLTSGVEPDEDRCALLAQVGDIHALEIGINTAEHLYLIHMNGLRVLEENIDISNSHRVMLLTLADRLLVYRDGHLVADEEIVADSGYFGIKVQGGVGTTCEATDLWVYRVPASTPGACEIMASGGAVNKRTGPGIGFEISGILDSGASQPATAQSIGSDALTWWQLADGGWVREDVVQAVGDCRGLPNR